MKENIYPSQGNEPPESHAEFVTSNEEIEEMRAAMLSIDSPTSNEIIVQSIAEKAFPELARKINSQFGKEVLTILTVECLTPELLEKLRREIAISTNRIDKNGERILPVDEAVEMLKIMSSMTGTSV
ncbi:MAG: hypothetical protein WCP03_00385 [Candidatus Saccharibacteria bacterium]